MPASSTNKHKQVPASARRTTRGGTARLLLSPEGGGGYPVAAASDAVYSDAVTAEAKLTGLAAGGGCAAKYSAARLEELLRGFVPAESENLLVGLSPADDAAVYKLDDERALIFTVDFFPPLVDDPEAYGAIAATNALNDVFAMGGTPLLALSIAAFPEELPLDVPARVFAAADEQVRAAGALLAGGHTIRDDEPKYGLAVVGTAHPKAIWPKNGARPGDAVFLTKPLGTGLVLAGWNRDQVDAAAFARAVEWMCTLNAAAADALRGFAPNAVTDVTGFGLLGHAHEVAERSGVRIVLDADALPMLDGALAVAANGIRTGGDPRNRDFAGPHVEADGVDEALLGLAYDPQTAGGLLVSLPAERGAVLEAEFAARQLFLRRIGRVVDGAGVALQ
jgi:selenide,water dikinase